MSTVMTAKGTELPLLNLKGKAYLQVAHRLVWFREEHPDWSIMTEFVRLEQTFATAKASILTDKGQIMATAHKSEDKQGFPDFAEKAETGAIGRALALCGYGTQFTDDLEEGGRLADAPLITKNGPKTIVPEQPNNQDGNIEPTHYKITFGKWSQRSLEEIHRNHGEQAIADYIDYIEAQAAKKNQPITGAAKEFIDRASSFLAAVGKVQS